MRDIKLRAWDKTRKRWVGNNASHMIALYDAYPEVLILMQFTGLCDRNGKDLDWWEGDILECGDRRCIIRYDDAQGLWRLFTPFGNRNITIYKAKLSHWTKIGNIHERPELLEKAKC